MSEVAIKIEGLSKQYRLGSVGTGTLTYDLQRWWAKSRGKEDPTLQIGVENTLSKHGGDFVYALRDIHVEVKQGEILGVIGKNGAGKSTLLKILSRVTTPSIGTIDIYGRVASLLEVGTGFHPELTGRENIFLNGAIMGMTKQEIKLRFDEIVEFAGVGKYIDTPVKRYSSGMYVRLAFAVAAHLEPEILIVDEVLAVGDAEFQKKAIGKMQDVSQQSGRTVLFVSHNMGAVSRLCTTGLMLKNGSVHATGKINDVIDQYVKEDAGHVASFQNKIDPDLPAQVLSAKILKNDSVSDSFSVKENIDIEVVLRNISQEKGVRCNIGLWDIHDNLIMVDRKILESASGEIRYRGILPGKVLIPNRYKVTVSIDIPNKKLLYVMPSALFFEVVDSIGIELLSDGDTENGLVKSSIQWERI